MAININNNFANFLPATQSVDVQIRPVAQVDGGVPDMRGVQSMAQVAANVAAETEALGKTLKAQERNRQLSAAKSEFNLRRLKTELESATKPYKEAPDYVVRELEKHRQELADSISDPVVRDAFSQSAVDESVQTISKVSWGSKKREIEDNINQLSVDIDKEFEALSIHPENFEQTEFSITGKIQAAVKDGLIDQNQGELQIEGAREKIDEIRINGLKNDVLRRKLTPEWAIKEIENRDNFTHIDPVFREKAIMDIRNAAESVQLDDIRTREHKAVLERQELERNREAKRDEFTARIFNSLGGQSKEPIRNIKIDIMKAADARQIDGPQQAWLMNLANDAQTGPEKDDPAAYARAIENINKGTINENAIVYNPGLTSSTKIGLLNKMYDFNKSDLNEKQTNAIKKIESIIITTGPGATLLKGDEQQRFRDAVIEFDLRIDESKQKGAVDFDQITDEIIWKYGNPDQAIKNEEPITIPTPAGPVSYRPTIDDNQLKELKIMANKVTDPEQKKRLASTLRRWSVLRDRRLAMPTTVPTAVESGQVRGAKPKNAN
jgi:hypothetical protein